MLKHFARYGVLGIPVDDLSLPEVLAEIDLAVQQRRRMSIATVNTNFLVSSWKNPAFLRSVVASDLCTVDGIGMLLVCRLLSVPLKGRVSGADILARLFTRSSTGAGRPLRVFFFGGAPGVVAAAKRRIDEAGPPALVCVGALDPGFGSVEQLSGPEIIEKINAATPDLLLVSLGAEKGQAWLMQNQGVLDVPVRSHFGAALAFLGGSVRRAPQHWQNLGMEWLWRIWQEPQLASRYWHDGLVLFQLLLLRVLPQMAFIRLRRMLARPQPLLALAEEDGSGVVLRLTGTAVGALSGSTYDCFERARASDVPVRIEIETLDLMDVSVMGEIMRLRHDLAAAGRRLTVSGGSPTVRRFFHDQPAE